jgi:hypothetical protein
LANGAETDADSGLLPAIGSSRDATNY